MTTACCQHAVGNPWGLWGFPHTRNVHMASAPSDAAADMFRPIGEIVGEIATVPVPVTGPVGSDELTVAAVSAAEPQADDDDGESTDSDAVVEQGEPEAFVMNQVRNVCHGWISGWPAAWPRSHCREQFAKNFPRILTPCVACRFPGDGYG
jgi:hypothetical protein